MSIFLCIKQSEQKAFRQTPQWIDFANKIKDRDGRQCRLCGQSHRLTVHHIDDKLPYDDLDPANFVTLCGGDHIQIVHRFMRSIPRTPFIAEMKKIISRYLNERKD